MGALVSEPLRPRNIGERQERLRREPHLDNQPPSIRAHFKREPHFESQPTYIRVTVVKTNVRACSSTSRVVVVAFVVVFVVVTAAAAAVVRERRGGALRRFTSRFEPRGSRFSGLWGASSSPWLDAARKTGAFEPREIWGPILGGFRPPGGGGEEESARGSSRASRTAGDYGGARGLRWGRWLRNHWIRNPGSGLI